MTRIRNYWTRETSYTGSILQSSRTKSLELGVGLNPNPALLQLCDLERVAQPLCAHFSHLSIRDNNKIENTNAESRHLCHYLCGLYHLSCHAKALDWASILHQAQLCSGPHFTIKGKRNKASKARSQAPSQFFSCTFRFGIPGNQVSSENVSNLLYQFE